MTATLVRPVAQLPASCWCERTEVLIPVQWISEARTGSCGPNCGPGCPVYNTSTPEPDIDPTEVARTGKKIKMKRFNPATYDPRTDSSVGYSQGGVRVHHIKDLILEVQAGEVTLCACGCGEQLTAKSRFRMGHDARLRGKLTRAHIAQASVTLTDSNHIVLETISALDYAQRFNTAKSDWIEEIKHAAAKNADTNAEKAVVAKALGPQVGDTKLIKVGRWEKTGKVCAVYQDGAEILYEYVDGKGNIQQARQTADGKITAVAS